jgi:N,N'-diacetyllegionaminate synthase
MRMKIGDFNVGNKAFIVAEIGNNHNGDFETAKMLVREAARAGADAVKFQTFDPDKIVHKDVAPPAHARGVHKTQRERLASIALDHDEYEALAQLASSVGVVFLSTPFDEDSVEFLDKLVPAFKIASGDVTNIPLLKLVAKKRKPVIISTGMATDDEIQDAVDLFPREDVILLHCIAQYPTPIGEANLKSIPYLHKKFNVLSGYSDHTIGLSACKTAIALDAVLIEKHFTWDKTQPVGDHKLSMDPNDLVELVKDVRQIESLLGSYGNPLQGEKEARRIMRRSLYASRDIKAGEIISDDMCIALRPADGMEPKEIYNIYGKIAVVDIPKDGLLKPEMFAK